MALSAEQARHTENVFHIALREEIIQIAWKIGPFFNID